MLRPAFIFALIVASTISARAADAPPTYAQVRAIFAQHCLSCHDAKEAENGLVLETHQSLMKGGDSGPAIVPGKSAQSPLVKQIEHKEKPFMPPPQKGDTLSDQEIALIKAWIDAGAPAPPAAELAFLNAPKPTLPAIKPKVAPKKSIYSLAYAPQSKLIEIGRPHV